MLVDHFPLLGLRIRTPRLELRLPAGEELGRLADLAAEGIHDPGWTPFLAAWTDLPPDGRARSVVQHYWRMLGACEPDLWSLPLTVLLDGEVVGQQNIGARHFAVLREVHSGSWLGRRFQGQGIGTEMRAAVLHLAFAGLAARAARSSAFDDNPASLAVSRKNGYRPDGVEWVVSRGEARLERRLRLNATDWRPTVPVTLDGLGPCLPLLGVTSGCGSGGG
jgi:RimJ/RimL family protein N-acetyltransferase